MFDQYSLALAGILLILATVLVQSLVAAFVKAAQPGAVPGKIDAELSHASFVFRANRTIANSLENLPTLLGAAFLAILAGANVNWTVALIWVYAVARIMHMILYYVISTERNPSPRSHFYLLGVISNIALLVLSAISLI